MLPIFKDFAESINFKTGLQLEEGLYWIDNQIIKVFDTKGNIHKVHRLKTQPDLSMTYTTYKKKKSENYQVVNWEDTIKIYNNRINELEMESIELLQKYGLNTDRKIIDTNSTGKDSEVKTYLARKAGLQFNTYFNVTTLDVADSNKMAKEKGYKPILPNTNTYGGFYQYIKRDNVIPTRFSRLCCKIYKEGSTIDYFSNEEKLLFLLGMRNDESSARSGYDDVWVNDKWVNKDWIGILPIRKWTDLDIWLYMLRENIDINPKYKKGYERVGCGIACPFYTKSTWVLDQYWYPKMYERWQRILEEDFIKNNKWIIMNCTLEEYKQQAWNGGVFTDNPTEEVIQEYATYNNLDIEVAKKYFNKYCSNGCVNKKKKPLRIKDKSILGMNMKLYGRQIEKFMCKNCLMKEFGWNKDDWNNQVKKFKDQGCDLF